MESEVFDVAQRNDGRYSVSHNVGDSDSTASAVQS
jgi:hypothetical protein